MKSYSIQPCQLKGAIAIPPSKSHSIRAILFATLATGKSHLKGLLASPDIHAALNASQSFGAKISFASMNDVTIEGVDGQPRPPDDVINAGNSGLILRFFGGVAALSDRYTVITGDSSVRSQRPVKPLLDGLKALGAFAESMRGDGRAPIIVKGPIAPGRALVAGEDSQPVSALLIAGAFAPGTTQLHVDNPGEKPWVGLTLSWFDRLGIPYEHHDFTHYQLFGKTRYSGFDAEIPGDFSTAAYPIAAALVTQSEVSLTHVEMKDPQGDKKLIDVLRQMGASIEVNEKEKSLTVRKGPPLQGMTIDVNEMIDALPILAVVGCFSEGETHLHNGKIARKKESDRIKVMVTELKRMGANITETEDGMIIKRSSLGGTSLSSHGDHRVAMSLAVAGMGAAGTTVVEDVACVAKSYPTFFDDMQQLGASIFQDESCSHWF